GRVRGAAVLIESAGPESLRKRVVQHHVRHDVPREVRTALPAGLGVLQILRVEVVGSAVAAARRYAALEAAEAARNTAFGGIIELEMARAGSDRQYLRNDVVVRGGKEGKLLGLAHGVLIEGGMVAQDPRTYHRRIRRRADIGKATTVAG